MAKFIIKNVCRLFLGIVLCTTVKAAEVFTLQGKTMGTTWSVKVVMDNASTQPVLKKNIQHIVNRIDAQASTWNPHSVVSKFNAWHSKRWFSIPPSLMTVFVRAQYWSQQTQGNFDITVEPLVKAYGFDVKYHTHPPTATQVKKLLHNVGYGKLILDPSHNRIRKKLTGVRITLSGIIKGKAVDDVATYLIHKGIKNYVVEIGGEVRVKGTKPKHIPWLIGIQRPDSKKPLAAYTFQLHSAGIATSGVYRNYYLVNGKKYTHIINPRTGMPVSWDVFSVTVVLDNTEDADALATAMMVYGYKDGIKLANKNNWAVAFLVYNGYTYNIKMSKKFKEYT